MTVFLPDFVKVTIDGVDRTEFVIDYHRFDSLCELGQQFTLSLSFEYPATLEPYQPVVITERYDGSEDVVLRGFIITIDNDFTNSNFTVQGHDKSILLSEFFVSEQIISEGQSVDFFIQFFADLVGLNVEFQATSGPNAIVDEGTNLGLQFAADAVLSIERIAAYYTKFDSKLDKLVTFRLGSSEPAIEINRALEGIRNLGTEKTRNVVKVYGGYKFNTEDLTTEQIFAQARTDIPELLVDKTVVVTNSFLRRQTFAFIVADRLLNTVNSIDDTQQYQLPGLFPELQVGQVAHINLPNSYYIDYEGDRTITSIDVVVGSEGAITTVAVGEKCPRISITFPIPPIYATTTQDGVAVSFDGGDSFKPSNLGLTVTDELDGKNIAANSYGQQMVNTAAGIFRRFSSQGTWLPIPTELPDPVNDSADLVPVTASGLTILNIVDEPTHRNVFHLLATGFIQSGIFIPSGFARAWVYSTLDFGNSWDSTQLYVPASGIFVTETLSGISGRAYDVLAHDLTTGVDNKSFVEVSSREENAFITPIFPKPTRADKWYYLEHDPSTFPPVASANLILIDRDANKTILDSLFTAAGISLGTIITVPGRRDLLYNFIQLGFNTKIWRIEMDVDTPAIIDSTVVFDVAGRLPGLPTNHSIPNFDQRTFVDHGSLRVHPDKVRIGFMNTSGIKNGPTSSGNADRIIQGYFFEDDITQGADNASFIYKFANVPSMARTYTDQDGESFDTGNHIANAITNPNGYGTAGSSRFTHTTNTFGNNKAFKTITLIVRPEGFDNPAILPPDDHIDFFPGHANVITAVLDMDAKSVGIYTQTRFEEFILQEVDGGPIFGPHARSLYPASDSDGNDYFLRPNLISVRDGVVQFGLMWETDNTTKRLLIPFETPGVSYGIGDPITIPDSQQLLYEDLQELDLLEDGNKTINCGFYGRRFIFDLPIFVDAKIYSDSGFTLSETIKGQVMLSAPYGPLLTDNGQHYIVVRDGWEDLNPTGDKGQYNIYEAPLFGGSFKPVFPASIERMSVFEQPPFGTSVGVSLFQIASEEEI